MDSRLKDRSGDFKARPGPDFAAESQANAKSRRQDHVDMIRKMERVRERLSPQKSDKGAGVFNETDKGFANMGRDEASMGAGASSAHQKNGVPGNSDGRKIDFGEGEHVTLAAIGDLLDGKLGPLSTSVNNVEKNVQDLRDQFQKEIVSIRKHVDTMHSHFGQELQKMEKRMDRVEGDLSTHMEATDFDARIDACEQSVLDVKEYIGDVDMAGHNTNANAIKIRELEGKIKHFEEKAKTNGNFDHDGKISELEARLRAMSLESKEKEVRDKFCKSALFGGFGKADGSESSKEWLGNQLLSLTGERPDDIYHKGEWNGLLFAKFPTKEKRDHSLEKFRRARPSKGGSQTWGTEDLPVKDRIQKQVLFAAKKLMIEYGHDKFLTWVDVTNFALYDEYQ
eukprot:9664570-Karenia_brevis.AAC.1